MPSNNDADDSIQLSFTAIDPFRKRRGRWERRQKPQDVESGIAPSDPERQNPASGSPAPASSASTTPASVRLTIDAGQAPIVSVVAQPEPSDDARGASFQASPTAVCVSRFETLEWMHMPPATEPGDSLKEG